jgi:hypothetical protein
VRDRRLRFGDPEEQAAECSYGRTAGPRRGVNAERLAKRDATKHIDRQRETTHAQP